MNLDLTPLLLPGVHDNYWLLWKIPSPSGPASSQFYTSASAATMRVVRRSGVRGGGVIGSGVNDQRRCQRRHHPPPPPVSFYQPPYHFMSWTPPNMASTATQLRHCQRSRRQRWWCQRNQCHQWRCQRKRYLPPTPISCSQSTYNSMAWPRWRLGGY